MNKIVETNQTAALSAGLTLNAPVGLAFQGGSFLGGAVATGTIKALVEGEVFKTYDICAFTGTSAGAIVAAACWCHATKGVIEGKEPQAAMAPVPSLLERLWLHHAKRLPDLLLKPGELATLIPNQEYGDLVKFVDNTARYNWFYDKWMQTFWARSLRIEFKAWIREYIERDDLEPCVARLFDVFRPISDACTPRARTALAADKSAKKAFAKNLELPGFVFGSADVINGEIMGFSEYDVAYAADAAYRQAIAAGAAETTAKKNAIDAGIERFYDFIEASGSLEEINDKTTIADGPHAGVYLDGAWGQNPPLNEMIDYGVKEIWLVEIFPKKIEKVPESFSGRRDRQEELWQNSLIEHELYMIDKINEWLERKYFVADAPFRKIKTRRIPMTLDFTPGARIVNWEPYLVDKITHGLSNGRAFVGAL